MRDFFDFGPIDGAGLAVRRRHLREQETPMTPLLRLVEIAALSPLLLASIAVVVASAMVAQQDADLVVVLTMIGIAVVVPVSLGIGVRRIILLVAYRARLWQLHDPRYTSQLDPRLNGRRLASDPAFFDTARYARTPSGMRQAVSLLVLGVCTIGVTAAGLYGAFDDDAFISRIGAAVACGVVAGALYHPSLQVWPFGAVAGGVVVVASRLVGIVWFTGRTGFHAIELAVPTIVCAIPVGLAYRFMLSRRTVGFDIDELGATSGSTSAAAPVFRR